MPENKFDLIKALSGQQLYTPINYGTSYLDPNFADNAINNVRETYPLLFINEQKEETEEEKKKRLEEEIKKAADKSNQIWSDLGNSEDAYEGYNAHESDPQKQAEFRRNGDIVAGIGSTIATLPFTAGMMGGVPAVTTTVTGVTGGYAGAYGGQQLGQYIDNKYGGNTTPYLTSIGGFAGSMLGGGLGYKGLVNIGSRGGLPRNNATGNLYGKQFITDVTSAALNKNVSQIIPVVQYSSNPHKITFTPTRPNQGTISDKFFEKFYELPEFNSSSHEPLQLLSPEMRKIFTHGIESKNFIKLINGKGNKSSPNPSIMATSVNNPYNGYGDVVLLGDSSLLKNSYFFNGDGGTSTVRGLGPAADDIADVGEVSRRMKYIDDHSQVPRISELDLRRRVSSNPYDYAEVKRTIPTPITDFKHAFVSKNHLTPELQNALKNSGIPFTITTNPIDFEIKSFVSQNPQFIGKKGGKIKTQA